MQANTDNVIRTLDGWISTKLIAAADGTRVIIHSEWRDTASIEAMRRNADMVAYFPRIAALASLESIVGNAFGARDAAASVDNPRAWLFRIAHNAALDLLRRRARTPRMETEGELDVIPAPEPQELPEPDIASASLRSFMRLPALQRAAVILKDVLDHSLDEVATISGTTEPAAKSALQRGRERLREIAKEPEGAPRPALSAENRARLDAYVEGFTTHDFDAVRAMLAEDVRLDLVARLKRQGRSEVGAYLGRYDAAEQWVFAADVVEGRPAMLVYDRRVSLAEPAHFVVLEFDHGRVLAIRDFLFARYVMESVDR